MTILEFKKKKQSGEKITVVTSYDFWSARIIAESSIDCILVGDSASNVMHGFTTTLPISVEMMSHHVAAVARGAPQKLIVADLPFLSFRKSLDENMNSVELLMKAGAHAVKLEGVKGNEELIRHIVDSGVPVMGHIGLVPQSVHQLGGYKVQGREDGGKLWLTTQAKSLQEAGCFSVVLECVPQTIATHITAEISIPTIGIGAGSGTDGQVLVLHDMLGMYKDLKPKFVRKFMKGHELILEALNNYSQAVQSKEFPTNEESYE